MKEYNEQMNICFRQNGFKEILLNSINHKQYEENNPIQISIYDDKIYVWNDGKFPDEIAKQDLYKKHYSKPYNPLIAQTFFKAGFVESWGRGFEKIKKECVEHNSPLPEVEIKNSGVMVKCLPSKVYMDLLNKDSKKKGLINDPINDPIKLTEVERKIIELVKENNKITRAQLVNRLKINESTVKRNLNKLKAKGLLKRFGANKNGYWTIL